MTLNQPRAYGPVGPPINPPLPSPVPSPVPPSVIIEAAVDADRDRTLLGVRTFNEERREERERSPYGHRRPY